jgi:hypothetical protein
LANIPLAEKQGKHQRGYRSAIISAVFVKMDSLAPARPPVIAGGSRPTPGGMRWKRLKTES